MIDSSRDFVKMKDILRWSCANLESGVIIIFYPNTKKKHANVLFLDDL